MESRKFVAYILEVTQSFGIHYKRPHSSDFSPVCENWSLLICSRLDDRNY